MYTKLVVYVLAMMAIITVAFVTPLHSQNPLDHGRGRGQFPTPFQPQNSFDHRLERGHFAPFEQWRGRGHMPIPTTPPFNPHIQRKW